jgi:hypothetical protein
MNDYVFNIRIPFVMNALFVCTDAIFAKPELFHGKLHAGAIVLG